MTTNLTIETFPNEAAANYIHGKAIASPENFGALPDQLKQRAFTVASIEQTDVLRKIRDAIAKVPEGSSWDEAKKEIAAHISPFVGTGDAKADMAAAKARASFLLRTHGFQAYAVARHQQQMETVSVFPYWKYETVGDDRVRSSHKALDGKIVKANDPWWKTHYPPWDWGCRCIVVSLDEEDAISEGITPHNKLPMPERSDSYTFDASDASADIDKIAERMEEPDWRIVTNGARNATVERDDGSKCTMWDFMLDRKMSKVSKRMTSQADHDGKERGLSFFLDTGKTFKNATGDATSVQIPFPKDRDFGTLHIHTNGDNYPSPSDFVSAFQSGSKLEYIAAGSKLRRWKWLKTPEPEDARIMREFERDNNDGVIDIGSFMSFVQDLVDTGFIKMEVLS